MGLIFRGFRSWGWDIEINFHFNITVKIGQSLYYRCRKTANFPAQNTSELKLGCGFGPLPMLEQDFDIISIGYTVTQYELRVMIATALG